MTETWQAREELRNKLYAGLGVRARNALWNSRIESREQAADMTDAELLRIPNFGRKALAEVRAWVAGCTPAELADEADRLLLDQKIERARAEVRRAQERLEVLESQRRIDEPETRLLRLKAVTERTGMTRANIYNQMFRRRFPKPVKIGGRAVAWVESEIADWIADRIAERDA